MTTTTRRRTFAETYPNGVEAAVRDGVGGVAEARRAIDRLRALTVPEIENDNPFGQADAGLAERLLAEALQGDVTPDQLLDLARRSVVDFQAKQVAASALEQARVNANRRLAGLASDNDLMAGYSEALEVLVEDLRDLEPLEQLADAAVAAAAGRLEDHQQYSALLTAWTELRRGHRKLLENGILLQLPEAAVFPDVIEVFPHWVPWRSHGYLVKRTQPAATSKPIETPWPHVYTGDSRGTFNNDADHPGFLLWAVSNDVPLRLATGAEYEKTADHLNSIRFSTSRQKHSTEEWVDPGSLMHDLSAGGRRNW